MRGADRRGRQDRRDGLTIRPARPGEEAPLSDLAVRSKGHWGHDAAFLARSRVALTLHPGDLDRLDVRVAERDGVVVGVSAVGDGELELLFVDPPAIGTGVGAALLCDALGRHPVLLIESDPDAEPFYLRFGAVRIGTRVAEATGRELPLLRIARSSTDRWTPGRSVLRAADPRMAALVDARPELDPDAFFDNWPSDLWSALVSQVIGQQISLAAAGAIRRRLQALCGGPLPTPAQLLAFDEDTLRGVGLSRANTIYLHDLAARLVDGRLDLERLRALDDDDARAALTQVKGVGRFTADGVLLLTLRRRDIWPAADLALRRAVARVWELESPSLGEVDELGERFRPWRTLAAVYLLTDDHPEATSDR